MRHTRGEVAYEDGKVVRHWDGRAVVLATMPDELDWHENRRMGREEIDANGRLYATSAEMLEAALLCLDANGHLRGCEAGAGTDGDEDNCTAYCAALRKAVAKAEGRQE